MNLQLSTSQAEELDRTLSQVVSDMSSEIAATDNPVFRQTLHNRRELLKEIRALLAGAEDVRGSVS
jgi:hypothetical protein